mgnify:FL=1
MAIDKNKLRQKLQFMRENIAHLRYFQEMTLEEFSREVINEYAATRMLQIIIEAMLDICAHIIAREGWGLPKSYGELVALASQHDLIPREMKETYQSMVHFRNRVVHLYDNVDKQEIYDIIQNHLDDFQPFMQRLIERYF